MDSLIRRVALTMTLLGAAASGALGSSPVRAAPQADAANADPALVSQIASHLARAKGVRAQFTQTQTLAALREPLVSRGTLVFVRERGVIWRIDAPYRIGYVIGDAGVSEVDANGKRSNAKSAASVRGVAQVSKMMRAMLGGDLSALYSQFDVAAQGTPSQWKLELKPNQPQLAQAIKGLRMSGGAFLQTLRITLANGDITQIEFSNSEALGDLTPTERAALGAP